MASVADVPAGDSKPDAPVILKDGGIDASQLCCDDGVKKSGCQLCAENETCVAKMGTCIAAMATCACWQHERIVRNEWQRMHRVH